MKISKKRIVSFMEEEYASFREKGDKQTDKYWYQLAGFKQAIKALKNWRVTN